MNIPTILKSYPATIDIVDVEKRSVYGKITTNTPDRINDIILPEAIQTKNYLANPSVLWNHDWTIPAPAQCVELKRYESGLDGIAEFVKNVQFAEDLYQCVIQKSVRSISIGFNAISSKMNKSGERVFTNIDMLEYSFCNIGMNPEALTKALEIVKTPFLIDQFNFQKKSFEIEDRITELFESKQSFEDIIKNYSELDLKLKELEAKEDRINQIQETMNLQNEMIKKLNMDMQIILKKETEKMTAKKLQELVNKSFNKRLGIE